MISVINIQYVNNVIGSEKTKCSRLIEEDETKQKRKQTKKQ